jgi:hypothetical protein
MGSGESVPSGNERFHEFATVANGRQGRVRAWHCGPRSAPERDLDARARVVVDLIVRDDPTRIVLKKPAVSDRTGPSGDGTVNGISCLQARHNKRDLLLIGTQGRSVR